MKRRGRDVRGKKGRRKEERKAESEYRDVKGGKKEDTEREKVKNRRGRKERRNREGKREI